VTPGIERRCGSGWHGTVIPEQGASWLRWGAWERFQCQICNHQFWRSDVPDARNTSRRAGHYESEMARVKGSWDEARFERLFTDHFDAVLAYAVARTDAETAQDAVADAFLVAWRRLDEAPDPARAWLLAVTRKSLATQRRSRARQEAVTQRVRSGQARVFTSAEDIPLVDALSDLRQGGAEASTRTDVTDPERSERTAEHLCGFALGDTVPCQEAKELAISFRQLVERYTSCRAGRLPDGLSKEFARHACLLGDDHLRKPWLPVRRHTRWR
jgi:DNA-directed RNA polymerase specialized sigma24 family protein